MLIKPYHIRCFLFNKNLLKSLFDDHMSVFYMRLMAAFTAICLSDFSAGAQQRPDSARVIVLPDVSIQDRIDRLTLASGPEDRRTWHVIAPGNGSAVRFRHPRAGYHELRQLRVHLEHPGGIQDGGLRVRVASVLADGQPATDNLLPEQVVLDTRTLRRSRRTLTLQWTNHHLIVPPEGFFLVVEGVGQQPDEVKGNRLPPDRHSKMGYYEIMRRGQPQEVVRTVDIDSFPQLRGANYTGEAAEVWYRIPKTGEWLPEKVGSPIPMLEVVFD
ncbi:hypothetical protein EJV47_09245 [Hymenobacter gummosus]|uniref:Uncharacterized protein n=1 Tax=Hymenobacter gummosus TaxID=1776032 RepID=A0A3S0H7R0_9BACT|nr:hypothetical protein [Hymenobacter gummosus]RTQ50795.1 hypothetical protein EJV47_09245 [Hymenobacter gummosus]